jgi:hypothetical protein
MSEQQGNRPKRMPLPVSLAIGFGPFLKEKACDDA